MAKIIPFPKDKPKRTWIQAKGEKEAEIWIYDEIGLDFWSGEGLSAKQFQKDIAALGEVETITVHINSPGGSVFDGNTMYNVLKQHKARIVVTIDGLAASIASVIAMAGDEINIAENAMMMIHEGWAMAIGPASELRAVADTLEKVNDSIVIAYMTHAKVDEEQIIALMAAETWMSAEDAIGYGLADQITESLDIAAHFDMEKFKFKNIPKGISNANAEPATPKPAEVVEPPEPKLQVDLPAAVPSTEDLPLNPKTGGAEPLALLHLDRRKQRIDTTHGPLERSK